jgi:hypothetical protein
MSAYALVAPITGKETMETGKYNWCPAAQVERLL